MRLARVAWTLALVALGARPAAADIGALLGRRVTDVRVEARGLAVTDRGVLTLVETARGDLLTMNGVRQTIEHFVTLGRYADVRVGEPDGEGAACATRWSRRARDPPQFQGHPTSTRTARRPHRPLSARRPRRAACRRWRPWWPPGGGYPRGERTTPEGRDGTVMATFLIAPGRQTVVGRVTVDGPADATRGLPERLGLVPGRPLDADTLATRVDEAEDALKGDGYYEAIVNAQVTAAPEGGGADVAVRVNLGDKVAIVRGRRAARRPAPHLVPTIGCDRWKRKWSRTAAEHRAALRLEGLLRGHSPRRPACANGVLRITFDVDRGPLHARPRRGGGRRRTAAPAGTAARCSRANPTWTRASPRSAARSVEHCVRGFAAVSVLPQVTFPSAVPIPPACRWTCAFRSRGPRTVVTGVRIDGATALPEAQLTADLGLTTGKPSTSRSRPSTATPSSAATGTPGHQRAAVERAPC
jgi:hypothetical protein